MGLCASTTVSKGDNGSFTSAVANPLNNNTSGDNTTTQHQRKSSVSQAESKLQSRINSKKARKQVVMEAGEKDDTTKLNAEDLRLLQASLPEKNKETNEWLRTVLSTEFFMFESMEEETKNVLIACMEEMKDIPEIIIQQGDTVADYMYIVQAGTYDVIVNENKVATLGKNKIFGELALLYDAPRAATISIANQDQQDQQDRSSLNNRCILWRIGRSVFKYVIKAAVQASTSSVMETLDQVTLLKPLTHEQKLSIGEVLEPITFQQNEHIIHQNDLGNIFYIIKSGSVICKDINNDNDQNNTSKNEDLILEEGDYFGELALLTSKPRQRDVIALSDNTICLALDRDSFHAHLGTLDKIMSVNHIVRTLECMPLFNSNLTQVEKENLANSFETVVYNKGAVVVKEDESGDTFYIVVNGILQASKNNVMIANGQIKSNDFFGESALLEENGLRKATIHVMSDQVTLYSLNRTIFTRVLGQTTLNNIIQKRSMDRIERLNQATVQYDDLHQHAPLGCGTFGRVFLVTDKSSNTNGTDNNSATPMALKCMVKQQIVNMKMTSSINNERLIMSNIEHPFLLKLIATFQDHDQVYMLLDYVCGGELFSRLAELHHFPFAHSRFYAACVASAFEHLHRKEIIYRDLKPENLLIDIQGYLKVVDFGFAKSLKKNKKTYTVCGTPGKVVGAAVDVGYFISDLYRVLFSISVLSLLFFFLCSMFYVLLFRRIFGTGNYPPYRTRSISRCVRCWYSNL
jgi:cGMP-dependent protein kinase 1